MLANSLADVVPEEVAKRLLLDLNFERKAKKVERIGIGVVKRLAGTSRHVGKTWCSRRHLRTRNLGGSGRNVHKVCH